MKNYQLELRQIVDFPRCRIYREFAQADAPVFFIMSFFAPMPTSDPRIGA